MEEINNELSYTAIKTPAPITNNSNDKTITTDTTYININSIDNNEKNKKEIINIVSIKTLFRYADNTDYILILIGTITAIGMGVSQPLQIIFLGDIFNAFNNPNDTSKVINTVVLKFVYLGIATFFAGCFQVACWTISASRQTKKIRYHYVENVLRQEIGWYDVNNPLQLATRIADSSITIQDGIGRKFGEGIQFLSLAIGGFVIGLIKGWELALVIMTSTPLLALSAYAMMKAFAAALSSGAESYAKAGAIAEETFSNIRTIHSFNSIEKITEKYIKSLEATEIAGIKKGFATGFGQGILFLAAFITYAYGLYYGAVKVANDRRDNCTSNCYDGGKVLTVFFSIIMGSMAFGQAGPGLQAIYAARTSAYNIFSVIDRKSKIDPIDNNNKTQENKQKLDGDVEINNVEFHYPSRPDIQVCQDYSLKINAGEKVALVGASGSGKSTIISLIERFYDPERGNIKIDGIDIKDYNIPWLRSQISLVGQEPVLFSMSIRENIRYGKIGSTDEEIEQAAKMANAYDFIKQFPNGFDTEVGERGIQLSGGQKQRIAIARAIIKDPSILLLDEATSALDTESEKIVQQSLDKLLSLKRRTTIIVAHRLSTIKDANRIAVHNAGKIVELGTHDELMSIPNGKYRKLVETQAHNTDSPNNSSNKEQPQKNAELNISNQPQDNIAIADINIVESTNEIVNESESEYNVPMSRIWNLTLEKKWSMILGIIGAAGSGAVYPVWGVLISKMTVLFYKNESRHSMLRDAGYWSIGFAGIGVFYFISSLLQQVHFAKVSERFTLNIRKMAFKSMIKQEIGWFDKDENSSGALTTKLASDSSMIQSITSEMLNRNVAALCTLAVAFAISFSYSWAMTLVMLATYPILAFGMYVQSKVMTSGNNKAKNSDDVKAGSLLSEAVGTIRTVSSFNLEHFIAKEYNRFLNSSSDTDIRAGSLSGFGFGLSQGLLFVSMGFLFWFGGKLVTKRDITFEDMLIVIMSIMLSSFGVGIATQNMTDSKKSKKAASNMFSIIDRKPSIDSITPNKGIIPKEPKGLIEFKNLKFSYPSRPNVTIYKNYSLIIQPGETVALVGASGSGKSTAISLLQRFYDPKEGIILFDGINLKEINLQWLRSNISLVSQEPVLFSGTIYDNIAFGKDNVTEEEVINAAKSANAHNFIQKFPNGYYTDVGTRGIQISGGQKQRIALARAIIRDPLILLLDEATSALDTESEAIVQESLDALMKIKRRTTIVVAHRLSTIKNADKIAVTENGSIVELGTHDQLMKISDGIYKNLVNRQVQ